MTANRSSLKNLIERAAIAAVFLLVLSCLPLASYVFAQKQGKKDTKGSERKTLETKRQKLLNDVAFYDKQLKETRRIKNRSLLELVALNKKIEAREDLISTISSELVVLDNQIGENKDSINSLHTEVDRLKDEYKRMLRFAYRNRGPQQRLLFVFAADDINQAFRRLRYIRHMNDSRRAKADQLVGRQVELNKNVQALEQKKTDKKSLLTNEELEKTNLAGEKTDKEKVFSDLQTKEQDLKDEIEKKKKLASEYDQTIKNLIAEEIKRQMATPKPRTTPKSGTGSKSSGTTTVIKNPKPSATDSGFALTPEGQLLSNSFEGNKGALAWPVAQGHICESFGKHPHPVLEKVYTENNGIDILTSKGSPANAIFDGEVTGVAAVPLHGKLIIVRHGEYLSVYANLESVSVKVGDKVKKGQTLGKVLYDTEESKTDLHLEIWKGQTKLNPELWLAKQ